MSAPEGAPGASSPPPTGERTPADCRKKGLNAGSVGLIGAVVIGISCIAPAYTLTAALGPTVSEVGVQLPAIFLVGFIPMLLVAFGYRELNSAMPDAGTSFTWATRAFGPWIGWMAGWGLIAATIIVLSNLAGVAVDFFYLLIAQLTGNPGTIADLAFNLFINIAVCLVFMLGATWVSYRDMETTQKLQYVLVDLPAARARRSSPSPRSASRQRHRVRRHAHRPRRGSTRSPSGPSPPSPPASRSRSSSSGAGTSP